MKWYMRVVCVVAAAIGVVLVVDATPRASDEARELPAKSGCAYQSANCMFIIPVPGGRFGIRP